MADKQSKTEQATPHQIREARKKGQIARSQEVGVAAVFLALALVIYAGPAVGAQLQAGMLELFRLAFHPPGDTWVPAADAVSRIVLAGLLPFGVAGVVASLLAGVAQTRGGLFVKAAQPKAKNLDPRKGLKTYSLERVGAMTVTTFAKVALLTLAVVPAVMSVIAAAPAITTIDVALEVIVAEYLGLVWRAFGVAVFIAALDYTYRRHEWRKNLRMAKHEVKREQKDQDGDPQIKAARQRMARQWVADRGPGAIPEAAVLVTNPTHVAVALRYGPSDVAPTVLTAGRGDKARQLRRAARRHKVPIVRNRKLAWRLLEDVPVGAAVPYNLYAVVGAVIAAAVRQRPELREQMALDQPAASGSQNERTG